MTPPHRDVARDTNGFDEDGLDVDGFAAECPFEDSGFSEVLDDDPLFADLDAARDAGAGTDAGADVDAHELLARPVAEVLARLLVMVPDAGVVARLTGIDAGTLSPEDAIVWLQVAQRTEAWQAALAIHAYVAAGSGHALVQEIQAFDPHPESDEQKTIRIEDASRRSPPRCACPGR